MLHTNRALHIIADTNNNFCKYSVFVSLSAQVTLFCDQPCIRMRDILIVEQKSSMSESTRIDVHRGGQGDPNLMSRIITRYDSCV